MRETFRSWLAYWFDRNLTYETFRGWSDKDFAATLEGALIERGEAPAALLDEFHTRTGVNIVPPAAPTLDVDGLKMRHEHLREEVDELLTALEAGDLVKYADGLGDIVYRVYGDAWRTGIPLPAVLAAIHRSNMTKTPPPGDGKAIKGPYYRPPDDDLRAILETS
jgi:predicted HAD superfamily Cof-like phosphohydrolase